MRDKVGLVWLPCVLAAASVREINTQSLLADLEAWYNASHGLKLLCLHRKAGPPQKFNQLAEWAAAVGISSATLDCSHVSVAESRDALEKACVSGLHLLHHGNVLSEYKGALYKAAPNNDKAQQWIVDSALSCKHRVWSSLPSPRVGAAVLVVSPSSTWLQALGAAAVDPLEEMTSSEAMRVFSRRAHVCLQSCHSTR